MISAPVTLSQPKSGQCNQTRYVHVSTGTSLSDGSVLFQTKGEWTDHIKNDDWGSSVRARVKLRRIMGREPMKEEIPKKLDTGDVTTTEIWEAFDRGDEVRARASQDE
jgi:hypothetical protein